MTPLTTLHTLSTYLSFGRSPCASAPCSTVELSDRLPMVMLGSPARLPLDKFILWRLAEDPEGVSPVPATMKRASNPGGGEDGPRGDPPCSDKEASEFAEGSPATYR